jgi:hypothetical protein
MSVMREWTRGELQAFGSVAKILFVLGILSVGISWSTRDWLWIALGALMSVAGLALGIVLFRYQRRTGHSVSPFRKDETRNDSQK